MGMEVSSDGRKGNFVLLVGRVFGVGDVEGMSENAVWGEEAGYKVVPVGEIILALGTLSATG